MPQTCLSRLSWYFYELIIYEIILSKLPPPYGCVFSTKESCFLEQGIGLILRQGLSVCAPMQV